MCNRWRFVFLMLFLVGHTPAAADSPYNVGKFHKGKLQFINGLGSIDAQTSGVAYWAHIGGFIAGIVITFLAKPFLNRERANAPPTLSTRLR